MPMHRANKSRRPKSWPRFDDQGKPIPPRWIENMSWFVSNVRRQRRRNLIAKLSRRVNRV